MKTAIAWFLALSVWGLLIYKVAQSPNPPPMTEKEREGAAQAWVYQRVFNFVFRQGI